MYCNKDRVAAAVRDEKPAQKVPVCVRSGRQLRFRVVKPMRAMGFVMKSCRPRGRQLFGLADSFWRLHRTDAFLANAAGSLILFPSAREVSRYCEQTLGASCPS